MTSQYRVEADIGAYQFSAQDGDVVGYGLADPCTITSSLPDSDFAPLVQANPMEASVSVIAPDPFSYAFRLGDAMRVAIYSNHSGGNNRAFFGRVASVEAQPHDLGVLYTLTGVDYLADLGEQDIGAAAAYPVESTWARIQRMFLEAGINVPTIVNGIPASPPPLVGRSAGAASLAELLESVLATWMPPQTVDELGNAMTSTRCRFEVVPNIVNPGGIAGHGALDLVTPYKLQPVYRPVGWFPPARLPAGAIRSLTVSVADSSPTTGGWIIDGGHVDASPMFIQRKGDGISKVGITTSDGFAVADWDLGLSYYSVFGRTQPPVVAAKLESPLGGMLQNGVGSGEALAVAKAYLNPTRPEGLNSWVTGELLWRASRTEATGWAMPNLRQLVTIARVDAVNSSSHNPTGKAWITGLVKSQRVTVSGGEVTVAMTLLPLQTYTDGRVAHMATWAAATLVGLTFSGLNTTVGFMPDSFADFQLLYA